MQMKSILGTVIAAMMLGAPAALAQTTPTQNPAAQNRTQPATGGGATQSAPAESSHASGHDAQSGQPETGPNAAKTKGVASEDYKDIHGAKNKK
jgi:Ni/Co efflux regulator RcnB